MPWKMYYLWNSYSDFFEQWEQKISHTFMCYNIMHNDRINCTFLYFEPWELREYQTLKKSSGKHTHLVIVNSYDAFLIFFAISLILSYCWPNLPSDSHLLMMLMRVSADLKFWMRLLSGAICGKNIIWIHLYRNTKLQITNVL